MAGVVCLQAAAQILSETKKIGMLLSRYDCLSLEDVTGW